MAMSEFDRDRVKQLRDREREEVRDLVKAGLAQYDQPPAWKTEERRQARLRREARKRNAERG